MNFLVAVHVFTRHENLKLWLHAYKQLVKPPNTKLVVINNCIDEPIDQITELIDKYDPDYYIFRQNDGMDIGACRDLIANKELCDWDVLLWCLDDTIPMSKTCLNKVITPFYNNSNLGLLGNYFVRPEFFPNRIFKGHVVRPHIRTVCYAITHDVAEKLNFPNPLVTKQHCYDFEWSSNNNLTAQVIDMGKEVDVLNSDKQKLWVECNDNFCDIGSFKPNHWHPLFRKDVLSLYKQTFGSP